MLAAPFGDEQTLISVSGQLEQADPWADRAPDMLSEHGRRARSSGLGGR
jgi:hypothetical protein